MNSNTDGKSPHDCSNIQDLIADYAFGLTDVEETRLIEANLQRCPEAAAKLADYRQIQAEMRLDVFQIEPPPHLGELLMAAIATTNSVVKPHRYTPSLAWWVAAAAIVALVITNIYWLTSRDDERMQSQNEIDLPRPTQPTSPFILTSAADLRWVRLPSSQENSGASAFMMWNAESEIGILYVQGFPQLPSGRTYQFWLTRGEERISAGTFRVDEEGDGVLLFKATEAVDGFTWARITDEPANGSDQPTGPVVVNGEL